MPFPVLPCRLAAIFAAAFAVVIGVAPVVATMSGPASAQTTSGTPDSAPGNIIQVKPPGAIPRPQYDEEELKAFAKAALEVRRLREAYVPQIEAATPETRDEVSRAASEALDRAVEQQGISLRMYDDIFAAAQTDDALAKRIQRHLGAAR